MFKIEFNSSLKLEEMDVEDLSITEAIQSVYPIDDSFTIFLGRYKKTGTLKGDFSEMWSDVLKMVMRFKFHGDFQHILEFPSQGYFGHWEIIVRKEIVEVIAWWKPDNVELKDTLSPFPSVLIDKSLFIEEWEKLITLVCRDLTQKGYKLSQLVIDFGCYSVEEKIVFLKQFIK